VDTDILIDPTQIQCMEGYGVTFFVARGFVSSGNVDSNVCNNLDNAYSAKMKYRDVYMIPCKSNPNHPMLIMINLFYLILSRSKLHKAGFSTNESIGFIYSDKL
jgi:hypothetical protein